MFQQKILYENEFYPAGDILVEKLYKNNPELKSKFKVQRIKFALSSKQRAELLDLAENTNDKHFAMIKTQLELGLRVGELVNLPIKHINLSSKLVDIKKVESGQYLSEWHPKTTSGQRTLPLTPELSKVLRRIIGKRKEGYVFESRKKGKDGKKRFYEQNISDMVSFYSEKCKSIAKKIGSHALRRTYASYLINDGVEIGKISKTLGHASIRTTMIYLYDIVDIDGLDTIRDSIAKMNPKSKNNDDLEEDD
jgi:integrase/recombinase XerD